MTNYVSREKYLETLKKSRFWFFSTVLLLTITIILSVALAMTISSKKEIPIIVGHGTMQKIGDNMFEIVEDNAKITTDNIKDIELPELPAHLLK